MPIISFKKNFPKIEVERAALLMKTLVKNGRPVGSSCQGEGVCSKCVIQITSGLENLSSPNEIEKSLIKKFNLKSDQRVSCQAQVYSDIEVDALYW